MVTINSTLQDTRPEFNRTLLLPVEWGLHSGAEYRPYTQQGNGMFHFLRDEITLAELDTPVDYNVRVCLDASGNVSIGLFQPGNWRI